MNHFLILVFFIVLLSSCTTIEQFVNKITKPKIVTVTSNKPKNVEERDGAQSKVSNTSTQKSATTNAGEATETQEGLASYYAAKYSGNKTANGETYDPKKFTAAHKTLPFNTQVLVINKKNQKTVTVTINDRLGTTSKRIIDLSQAAAQSIDMIKDGVANVQLKINKK